MTYGSEKILWRGKYGYVHVVALTAWNRKNRNAREEYRKYPFARLSASGDPFKISRRHWTEAEIRYLKRKYKEGVSYVKIARHLKRSPGACQQMVYHLGISTRKWSKRGRQDLPLQTLPRAGGE